MKKRSIISVFIVALFAMSFVVSAHDNPIKKDKMPDNVKVAINKSCFGCHNSDSKNEDAKEALDFKKLDGLSTIKKIGAYKEIGETIEEQEMPPKKFLERKPEKKLTDEEKELLINWSKKEAEALVKSK